MVSYESIKKVLCDYQQQHLLDYYSELTSNEQSSLLSEIANVDFPSFTSKTISLFRKLW